MSVFSQPEKPEAVIANQLSLPVELSEVAVTNADQYSSKYIATLLEPLLKRSVYSVDSLVAAVDKTNTNFRLSNNSTLAGAKSVIEQDGAKSKVVIKLPKVEPLGNQAHITTYTDEAGCGITAGLSRENCYGNGESLSILGGVGPGEATNFISGTFVAPAPHFNFVISGLHSSVDSSETVNQFLAGFSKSTMFYKGRYFGSFFAGVPITQGLSKEGSEAKSSVTANVLFRNVKTVSQVAFPVSGSQQSLVGEYGLSESFVKLFHRGDTYKSFGQNNGVTFHHTVTHALFFGENVSKHNKFSYGLAAPFFGSSTKPLFLNTKANRKTDGNFMSLHSFRLYKKLPIFSKYALDENSVLRLHLSLNTFVESGSFKEFQASHSVNFRNNLKKLGEERDLSKLAEMIPATIGGGLVFKSPLANAEIGYYAPLSKESKYASFAPGLKFDVSISVV